MTRRTWHTNEGAEGRTADESQGNSIGDGTDDEDDDANEDGDGGEEGRKASGL